jgi:hypothetical protein
MNTMLKTFALPVLPILAIATLVVAPIVVSAQNAPISSGMGNEDTGAPKVSLQDPLPGEKLIDRLKLDAKTQAPDVRLLLMDASREAAAPGQKMLELRQRLVNLAIQNKSDEMVSAVAAYEAAATERATVEARTFAKIYAILKPNQQANAPDAFAVMAGMFQPSPARAGGGRRGGGQ